MTSGELLREIKARLQAVHGKRLRGVVLYGSAVRGEDGPESDIDVLALLRGPVDHWEDARVSIQSLYPLIFRLDRSIHAKPVDVEVYTAAEFPLYQNARAEGMRI